MKSNLGKMIAKLKKRVDKLKNDSAEDFIILAKSHNQLNQIDIALKRIGVHGAKHWTPRLAYNTTSDRDKLNSHKILLVRFQNANCKLPCMVHVTHGKNGNIESYVHNHNCGYTEYLSF